MGRLLKELPVSKEGLLDALITKELLLQEAQNMNLDKERDFIKTIELYWEQTLIKNLMIKKSDEIRGNIVVREDEIADYYNKMKVKIKAQAFVFAGEDSARKLLAYNGNINEYVWSESERISLLYTIPSKVYG